MSAEADSRSQRCEACDVLVDESVCAIVHHKPTAHGSQPISVPVPSTTRSSLTCQSHHTTTTCHHRLQSTTASVLSSTSSQPLHITEAQPTLHLIRTLSIYCHTHLFDPRPPCVSPHRCARFHTDECDIRPPPSSPSLDLSSQPVHPPSPLQSVAALRRLCSPLQRPVLRTFLPLPLLRLRRPLPPRPRGWIIPGSTSAAVVVTKWLS
jgi:hypothetical protein